jgi:hypothetical protein
MSAVIVANAVPVACGLPLRCPVAGAVVGWAAAVTDIGGSRERLSSANYERREQ